MINFPQNPFKRAVIAAHPLAPVRQTFVRDILWNRPVFKAPALPNPAVEIEPLPFTAARITRAAR